jgi:predicted nucleic acid-binding protein
MAFVMDASVSVGWVIKNQVTDYSMAVESALTTETIHVPVLWWLEMTNTLRTGCKRAAITVSEAQGFIKVLNSLPIIVEPLESKASELFALALRHDLTSYDAAYLDLALRLQIPIATQDTALRGAALASGVGVWTPGILLTVDLQNPGSLP